MNVKCPVCSNGTLQDRISTAEERKKMGEPEADLHFSVCSSCESELTSPGQMSMNKANMLKYLASKPDTSKDE